jgi:hypothetical protein
MSQKKSLEKNMMIPSMIAPTIAHVNAMDPNHTATLEIPFIVKPSF